MKKIDHYQKFKKKNHVGPNIVLNFSFDVGPISLKEGVGGTATSLAAGLP